MLSLTALLSSSTLKAMSHWTENDIPDQTGRTFVITGANSGIGLEAARALAAKGAHVVLAVRDTAKGDKAAATIDGDTEVRRLDLADLDSVRAFAEQTDHLDVLINNAGVMNTPKQRTKDGFELQVGTNHLGHFALTNLLLDRISERVTVVASEAHRLGKIRLDDLNWEHGRYERHLAYGQAKLANLLFAAELQRKLDQAGSTLKVTEAHPGWAATNLQSHSSFIENALMTVGNKLLAQPADMGALPTLYAATMDIPGDTYIGPGGFGGMRGNPALSGRSGAAQNEETARALWQLSEKLTGVEFRLPASQGSFTSHG
jgi:NAD(P)-dependent dehydrogenase (short-subunit alcohol dehydrogenase family)